MVTISWLSLVWCSVPLVITILIYWRWCRDDLSELLIAATRMLVQLVAVGFVLAWIFARPSPWVSIAIMSLMLAVAATISVRPLRKLPQWQAKHWSMAVFALGTSVVLHLALTLVFVLPVSPWYSPAMVIPLAGMYFANSMNSISLSAERYFSERVHAGVDTARQRAFKACMIPQINGLLAVGLVALPGMMTGQILAGVDPLIAIRYQIMIMLMLLGATAVASSLMLVALARTDKSL